MDSLVDHNSNLSGCNIQADEKMDREYQRSLNTDEPLKPRVNGFYSFKFILHQLYFGNALASDALLLYSIPLQSMAMHLYE